jgi:hypothetical protein
MAEPTYRIEAAASYREPESQTPRAAAKQKPRPNSSHPNSTTVPAVAEPDDQDKHELDTLA